MGGAPIPKEIRDRTREMPYFAPNLREDDMTDKKEKGPSSGPLRIYRDDNGRLFVTGFGLWIEVRDEEDGQSLIAELEENGYSVCS